MMTMRESRTHPPSKGIQDAGAVRLLCGAVPAGIRKLVESRVRERCDDDVGAVDFTVPPFAVAEAPRRWQGENAGCADMRPRSEDAHVPGLKLLYIFQEERRTSSCRVGLRGPPFGPLRV